MNRKERRAAMSKIRKQKKKASWIPMTQMSIPMPAEEAVQEQMRMGRQSYQDALATIKGDEYWANDLYEAKVNHHKAADGVPTTHVMIRRRDLEAARDWRHLQRIKTDILGPECEAFELFPAESRLVDTANAYHLWAFPAGYRIPLPCMIGIGRDVRGEATLPFTKQRPLDEPEPESQGYETYEDVVADIKRADPSAKVLRSGIPLEGGREADLWLVNGMQIIMPRSPIQRASHIPKVSVP